MSEPTITVVGYLTRDPELRYTPAGEPVCNINIAVNKNRKNNQTNQWEKVNTTFYQASFWRSTAENIVDSLTKGMEVIVHGRLTAEQWQDNTGRTGTTLKIDGEHVGPSLKYAKVQVAKNKRSQNQPQQGYGQQPPMQGQYQQNTGYGQPQQDSAPPF